ncbi:hypothetical protein D3C87_1433920 [compost metagenome]
MAPMRLWARGPSGTLMASTPASRMRRTPSSIERGSQPLGGTISTEVTNMPRASLAPKRDRSESGTGSIRGRVPRSCTEMAGAWRLGDRARAASAICRMWSGVVPQQPPTNFTPAWMRRLAYLAM